MGHDVYLWSSTGVGYASSAAESLEVEDLIFGCYSKFALPPVTVYYVVDNHSNVVERYGGYTIISPFDGNPEDSELWRVTERLK